ncbi:hypothetical protein [Crenobacter cavernae]|uniref:Ketosynthase n=1 Tax=Crenobacter cavernae TaxID=2290923 RepID=A0ABY0FCU6_9NEIS|nr:hypothetical protein [Crenobacter cavernae]RXZ43865.1 hypothetical protein EBB06_08290 [Crenobacter cavernae]
MNWRVPVLAGGFAGYLGLSHWVLGAPEQQALLGVLLALVPPLAALVLLCLAAGRRRLALAIPPLVTALVWMRLAWFTGHFPWLYFLQDAGTQFALALMFGRTLLPGQTPLCSQIATLIHGELDAALTRYTRRVTQAWTLFFVAMTSVSTLLFFTTTLATWSFFSNLLVFPLTGLMFVVEFALRLKALPQWRDQLRFTDTFRAYRLLNRGGSADVGREP